MAGEASPGALGRLIAVLPPALVDEATRWLAGRLGLGDSVEASKAGMKLGLMMLRDLNPMELINQAERALLLGVTEKTLYGMIDREELPKRHGLEEGRQG